MGKNKKISSNMEDYLEAVAILKKKNSTARVRDISRMLGVKNSSVNSAMNVLSKNGLVIHERYGYVELTEYGEKVAGGIQNRHNILLKFLTDVLSIDCKIAEVDACKMEHSISPQTLEKITKFIEFVKTCPDSDRPDWLKGFDHYFKTGSRRKCKRRQTEQKPEVLG